MISSWIEVLCRPKAAKIARRPPASAQTTMARQCGARAGFTSSGDTALPLSTAVGAFDSRHERYASRGMQLTQLRHADEALDVVPVDASPIKAGLPPVNNRARTGKGPVGN